MVLYGGVLEEKVGCKKRYNRVSRQPPLYPLLEGKEGSMVLYGRMLEEKAGFKKRYNCSRQATSPLLLLEIGRGV